MTLREAWDNISYVIGEIVDAILDYDLNEAFEFFGFLFGMIIVAYIIIFSHMAMLRLKKIIVEWYKEWKQPN